VRRILTTAGLGGGVLRLAGVTSALAAFAVSPAVVAEAGATTPSSPTVTGSATGGTTAPEADRQPADAGEGSPQPGPGEAKPGSSVEDGGSGYHRRLREEGARQRRKRERPVLTVFQVSRSTLFALGRPATISYQVKDRSRYVRVRLAFVRADAPSSVHRVKLGRKRTGVTHTYQWHGTDERRFAPEGIYKVRLEARDPLGNRLVRSSQAFSQAPIEFATHRFPVAGPHSLGGPDSRFGAPRRGRSHQGQDIAAAEGTPVVAPRGGLITWRAYQAEGGGYYLVLAGEEEPYHYVFMHLQRGSILVSEGDRVRTGQELARVGNTGISSGPHLHFEIWHGPWAKGGRPIDPLPRLLAWKGGA
jgi:murein DD-endopeptidase MepM/ murein hydrolase activator NlpD